MNAVRQSQHECDLQSAIRAMNINLWCGCERNGKQSMCAAMRRIDGISNNS